VPFAKYVRKLLGLALMNWGLACSASAAERDPEIMTAASGGAGDLAPVAAGGAEHASDWCAVRLVLEAKCQRCHSAPPVHGAPFPLVAYEDTQVTNRRGEARFMAIAAVVADGFMPPAFITLDPAVEPLSADEQELLLGWCSAGGLPADEAACQHR
jgi:uncharacterized membrane protein